MRCKCCNRVLPPHRIMTDHDTEEDLCISCLGVVYYEIEDFYDVVDKEYRHSEHETPISQLLTPVNN